MSDMPNPPVPPEADLKDFAFTPIYRARLFGSAFHARASDAEWRAGVTLWLKSQDQVPAGSLPDDDIDLCRLAELGRDIKTWRKIREGSLRGWFKCSDGRLYHNVIAEIVNSQWNGKRVSEERREKWREKKRNQRGDAAESPRAVPGDKALKREREGQGEGEGDRKGESERERPSGADAPPPSPSPPALIDDEPDLLPIALDRTAQGRAMQAWNAMAQSHNLPQVAKLTKQRRAMLAARLRDAGGIEGITAAIERVAASPFCLGQNDRGWRANIDWFLSERGFTRLMEGHFEPRANGSQPSFAEVDRLIDEAMRGTA